MKKYRTIKPENVYKAIKKQGYFFLQADRYYDEEYTGPKYIIATEDENFKENHPGLSTMVIMSTEKFLKLADAINKSILNDEREMKRWERHHNREGYYEEIDETDDTGCAFLAIKDLPLNPVEDEVESLVNREKLLEAIKELKECPRRRIIAYYYQGKTQQEIADDESVHRFAIEKSLNAAIKKLKKVL